MLVWFFIAVLICLAEKEINDIPFSFKTYISNIWMKPVHIKHQYKLTKYNSIGNGYFTAHPVHESHQPNLVHILFNTIALITTCVSVKLCCTLQSKAKEFIYVEDMLLLLCECVNIYSGTSDSLLLVFLCSAWKRLAPHTKSFHNSFILDFHTLFKQWNSSLSKCKVDITFPTIPWPTLR